MCICVYVSVRIKDTFNNKLMTKKWTLKKIINEDKKQNWKNEQWKYIYICMSIQRFPTAEAIFGPALAPICGFAVYVFPTNVSTYNLY